MIKEITITVEAKDEKNSGLLDSLIRKELKKKHINENKFEKVFVKKSIDARHGQLKLHLRYKVYIGEKPQEAGEWKPLWKGCEGAGVERTVIIVGAGPAGLFGALKLLENGIKPIIIERGVQTSQRRKDIALISTRGVVNGDSNYCFGEGGAGTFSDGKLYTRSNKRGDIPQVLRLFAYFGADKKILTDAHPHIGTDKLPAVINAMRDKIVELGGEVLFNRRCCGFVTEGQGSSLALRGVRVVETLTGAESVVEADAVLLATGHSAGDVYMELARIAPESLEAKTFAVGVRVEHPRALIDSIQYHNQADARSLGAAEYRFTTQQDGRGVYSFCMCPGGFVVPSASGPDQIVVNGMSAAGRNSAWSNAAVVVGTRPEDIPLEFVERAEKEFSCSAVAGLLWRTELERLTASKGVGQKAPAQRMVDFLAGRLSATLPDSSYAPGLVSSDLDSWLPEQISLRLKKAFVEVDSKMHGYVSPDALLIAAETRTSTPVRILRDKVSGESPCIANLFPAGEGSGYSGGIVSSAMDGIKQCALIAERLRGK